MPDASKPKLRYPVVVEGRYDRIKMESLFEACVLTTDGFGIFREKEKLSLIRRLAQTYGAIIILTDSDGAGKVIRNYFNSVLPPEQLIHLYIPQISGKERRKTSPSKEGFLGVEGTDSHILRTLLLPFTDPNVSLSRVAISKTDFYRDGFSGGTNSAARRDALCRAAALPCGMSANALLTAINLLYGKEGYAALCQQIEAAPSHS